MGALPPCPTPQGGGKARLGAAPNPPGTSPMGSQAVYKQISAVWSLGSVLQYIEGQDGMRPHQHMSLFCKAFKP